MSSATNVKQCPDSHENTVQVVMDLSTQKEISVAQLPLGIRKCQSLQLLSDP